MFNFSEGYTTDDANKLITEKIQFVIDPELYVTTVAYRPIRVYVGGEVRRPGYYYLSDYQKLYAKSCNSDADALGKSTNKTELRQVLGCCKDNGRKTKFSLRLPRVFDAIQRASGVTTYSDLKGNGHP